MSDYPLDPVLQKAQKPFGAPRFYAHGQHPATHRLRRHVRALEALPSSSDRDAALAYAKGQIAVFEEGESLAKADYLRLIEGRP